jgi:hypothetical protein
VRLRTLFRISPAVWLTLPTLILSILYVTKATYPTNYGVAATAGATSSMAFLVGFVAMTAAWEAARLRRGGIWAAPHTRSRLEITIIAVTPSILLGAVFLLGTVAAVSVYGQTGMPELRIVAVGFVAICAWSLVGFLAGLRLPMSVSLPSMLLAPFLWFAFVPALPVEWLRQLSGMYRDCCRIGADIAPAALFAGLIMNVAIIVVALYAIGAFHMRWSRIVATAVLVTGVIVSSAFAWNVGPIPEVARDRSALKCGTVGATELCLWPEHDGPSQVFRPTLNTVIVALARDGLPIPGRWSEELASSSSGDTLSLDLWKPDPDEIRWSIAQGLAPWPACSEASDSGFSGSSIDVLRGWWFTAMGGSEAMLQENLGWLIAEPSASGGISIKELYSAVGSAPVTSRIAWLERLTSLAAECQSPVDYNVQ